MKKTTDEMVKLVVFVPETHAENVRNAIAKAGAGVIGNYRYSSFSIKGTGRFLPMRKARPTIGKVGKLTKVTEERIETVCYKKDLEKIIDAIKKVHPYEEIAFDIYPLLINPSKITHNRYINKTSHK